MTRFTRIASLLRCRKFHPATGVVRAALPRYQTMGNSMDLLY